ncbi:MAG: AraC family transcriptional regulator [Planctomycetaceae bacterium]|nr:AraC family transcriptional regulator [Planctomycetaceae bacterium]
MAAIAREISREDLGRLLSLSRGRGFVLVLRDTALDDPDLLPVVRRLPLPAAIPLAAPRLTSYETVDRWRVEAGVAPVDAENLEHRVLHAAAIPLRQPLPPLAWVPDVLVRDPLCSRLLLEIPRLGDMSPAGLSAAMGLSDDLLLAACQERFGIPPIDLLWEYRREYALHRLGKGVTLTEVAYEVGYGNKSNLLRALREDGVVLPARDPPSGVDGKRTPSNGKWTPR